MTESREALRRRIFRERADEPVVDPVAVRLDQLCLMPGCLSVRVDANVCRRHRGDKVAPLHECPGCTPRKEKTR